MVRGVVLVVVCVVAAAFTLTSAQEYHKQSSDLQQTPGLLERIMTNYVYPLRDYDWRGMLRRVMDNVMHYISPATKEPKAGYTIGYSRVSKPGTHNALHPHLSSIEENGLSEDKNPSGVVSNAGKSSSISRDSFSTSSNSSPPQSYAQTKGDQVSVVANFESSSFPPTDHQDIGNSSQNSTQLVVSGMCQFISPLFGSGLTLNSNVNPTLAAYSWNYLCSLLLFAVLSILGSILPVAIIISKEKLRGPGMSMSDMDTKSIANMDNMTSSVDMAEMDMGDMRQITRMTGTLGITDRHNRNNKHRRYDKHQRHDRLDRDKNNA